jgi:predicted RNA binding protein YcfA (HicA-like mRNA interferase family)
MTKRLPSVTAREIMRALERAGFQQVRSKGSHRVFQHRDNPKRRTMVADRGARDIPPGTLRAIIRQTGLTVEEFVDLL